MRSTILAASAVLLSFASFSLAVPQGGQGGGVGAGGYGQTTTSTISATRVSTVATTVSEAAASTGTVACNNAIELCNRNYNNITHMGAHDAAFLRDTATDFSVSGNQFYNVTVALSAGIRLIQAQVHNSSGTLELCHTSCSLLDGGSLESFLSEIKTWMDENTNDVVTLLLVNSDDYDAASFGSVFVSSGISKYGYTPTSTTGPIFTWPTLQTLITANTRLITFIASITYDSSYPYLLNEFDYVFETAFGVTSLQGFNCTLQRPSTISSSATAISSGYMGLLNHFADTAEALGITIPDITDIAVTNSPVDNRNSSSSTAVGSLGTHGAKCDSEWGEKPTFILVDFFNVGPSMDTADNLNGILGSTEGRASVGTAVVTAASSSVAANLGVRWSLVALGGLAVVNWVLL